MLGSAKFFKIASNFFKIVTQGRLLFCSLLKAEGGVALVHLWQGQVLGTQWRRGSQIAGLQDASDSHEVVLGSWQAVRERRTLRYTASERKILLTKTRKCSNMLESTWLCEGSMSSFRVSTLTAFWRRDNIFFEPFHSQLIVCLLNVDLHIVELAGLLEIVLVLFWMSNSLGAPSTNKRDGRTYWTWPTCTAQAASLCRPRPAQACHPRCLACVFKM